MGVWKNNNVDTCYVKVARDAKKLVKSITKCRSENPSTYKVKRCYHTHGTDSTLRKITTTLTHAIQQNCIVSPSATYRDMSQHHHHHPCTQCKLQYRSGPSLLLVTSENVLALGYHSDVLYHPTAGPDGQLCPLVLVVYTFEGAPEHDVLVRPHSSLKSNKPYCRTVKSVQEHLAKEVAVQSPKEAVRTVFAAKGGLKGAQSQGSLPMNPKQAYNISQKVKKWQKEQFRARGKDKTYCFL